MSTPPSQPGSSAAAAPGMNSLSLAYNENEDRLVLLLGTQDVKLRLLLTRRLTGGLINALADVLAQSSPGAQQAPLGMRESVVLFEHHDAVQAAARQQAAAVSAKAQQADKAKAPQLLPPVLVTVVDIAKKADSFALIFKGPEPIASFKAQRQELHQVLDLLRSKTLAARWALSFESGWLDAKASAQLMN